MPITSISGDSSSQSVRSNTEPAKGVSKDIKSKEKPEDEDAIAKQYEKDNAMKPGVANNEEEVKGVQEVDVNA